jgi:putative protease
MNRKPELLIPASSPEVLLTAVFYGADAVYIGGEAFSLRAKAQNFTIPEMKECVSFAHEHGVRVYVTANILAHNADLPEAEIYFTELKEQKVGMDALIISDPALFTLAKKTLPETEIHISTQANNVNYGTFRF